MAIFLHLCRGRDLQLQQQQQPRVLYQGIELFGGNSSLSYQPSCEATARH